MTEIEKQIWVASYARIFHDGVQQFHTAPVNIATCARVAVEGAYDAVDAYRRVRTESMSSVVGEMLVAVRGR